MARDVSRRAGLAPRQPADPEAPWALNRHLYGVEYSSHQLGANHIQPLRGW